MKLKIENLGNIKTVDDLQLGNLTIFVGQNNSGKTYLNYLLYKILTLKRLVILDKIPKTCIDNGIYKFKLSDFLKDKYDEIKRRLEKTIIRDLDLFFSAEKGTFRNTKVTIYQEVDNILKNVIKKEIKAKFLIGIEKNVCEVVKEKGIDEITIVFTDTEKLPDRIYLEFINEVLLKSIFSEFSNDVFILPAERTGLNLFYQELNVNRNVLVEYLQKSAVTRFDPFKILKDIITKYPKPISDYINFLNSLNNLKKTESEFRFLNKFLHKKIIGGKYVVQKDGGIKFCPYKKSYNGNNYKNSIDIHLSSSVAKTFFSLEFYLKHMAQKGDFLIVDEPELNLHPDNQRNVAKLLALIVNNGVNVILSTHSDYIIKEFNNLIMLNEEFPNKQTIMNKYDYTDEMILKKSKIKPYLVDKGKVKLLEIDKEGIIVKSFDDVINMQNVSSDDIYWSIIDKNEKDA
ncbi:AAA family ATPase [Nautilia sp.]